MRLLGIDYGEKRLGLAVSGESGRFAYPYRVLVNDRHLISEIAKICHKEGIGKIVLGESKDLAGKNNPLMKRLAVFKDELAVATGLPINWEPEFLTTAAAGRLQLRRPDSRRGSEFRPKRRKAKIKTKTIDASAAALILSSYLERQGNSEYV